MTLSYDFFRPISNGLIRFYFISNGLDFYLKSQKSYYFIINSQCSRHETNKLSPEGLPMPNTEK